MPETINLEKMYREILALRKEVQFIKNHVIEFEGFLGSEEETHLEESLEAHKKGKTKRYEDLKKELGD